MFGAASVHYPPCGKELIPFPRQQRMLASAAASTCMACLYDSAHVHRMVRSFDNFAPATRCLSQAAPQSHSPTLRTFASGAAIPSKNDGLHRNSTVSVSSVLGSARIMAAYIWIRFGAYLSQRKCLLFLIICILILLDVVTSVTCNFWFIRHITLFFQVKN